MTLTLELGSLRSREEIILDGDDVLVVQDPTVTTLRATWDARARILKGVLSDTIDIPLGEPIDIAAALTDAMHGRQDTKSEKASTDFD